MTSDRRGRLAAEHLAGELLDWVAADPSLIARAPRGAGLPPTLRPAADAAAWTTEQRLEELVFMAVAAAGRAEHAATDARSAGMRARRIATAFAGLGVATVIGGLAGFAGGRLAGPSASAPDPANQAALASMLQSAAELQRQAGAQLAAIDARIAEKPAAVPAQAALAAPVRAADPAPSNAASVGYGLRSAPIYVSPRPHPVSTHRHSRTLDQENSRETPVFSFTSVNSEGAG